MMIRRIQTRPLPEPPVKLYKTIALSFLVITIVLLSAVIFITSKKVSITVFTKEDSRHAAVTIPLAAGGDGVNVLKGTVSSTAFAWSKKYYPTGSKIVEGTSEGDVTLYNTGSEPQTLVKTTRLLSAQGILFHLSSQVIVPAGGQIAGQVYADKSGGTGDIAATTFTIPGLNEAKQKIVYAKSTAAFAGGSKKSGILSETDIAGAIQDYQQQVIAAYQSASGNGSGSPAGVAVTLQKTTATANKKSGEEVSEFIVSGNNTLLLIQYDPDQLQQMVIGHAGQDSQTAAEKILSPVGAPQVVVTAHDASAGTAELSVTQDVRAALDAQSPQLAPEKFTGKHKSEIEQYIMSLNHVSGVEIKFSPSWAQTAPGSAGRIKVVVKNIN